LKHRIANYSLLGIVRDLLTSVGYEIIEAVTGDEGLTASRHTRRVHF